MVTDVLIAGSGPAGLTLAAACAERGLRTALIAPDPDAPWVPTYASWVDALPVDVPFREIWPMVEVHIDKSAPIRIERAYGHVDREALHMKLKQKASNVDFIRGTVVATESDRAGTAFRDDRGRIYRARVLIDATGHRGARAYQTAFGWIAELSGLDEGHPRWMDFSMDPDDGCDAPSFLYALPFRDGTWLVEETALIRAPALPHELLQARLIKRLSAMGIQIKQIIATERCTIPMDTPLPPADGPIRFGSAAAMVHPSTGYLLPRVFEAAHPLAEAIEGVLSRGISDVRPPLVKAIWPGDRLRRHHLLSFGASAIAGFGIEDTRSFFRVFFSMPAPFIAGFLGDRLETSALVSGMSVLFYRLPARLRLRLLASGSRSALWAAALPHLETA